MDCPRCDNENPTDYPVCGQCAPLAHFTHRTVCLCDSCAKVAEINRVFSDENALRVDMLDGLPMAA